MTGHVDPEKQREYMRVWREANPEKVKEHDRRRRSNRTPEQVEANRQYQRDYRARNAQRLAEKQRLKRSAETPEERERRLQYHRDHYLRNREQYRLNCRRWIEQNRDRWRQIRSAWDRANPTKRVVNQQNRRAREGSQGPGIAPAEWEAMLDYFGHHCFLDWCENEQDLHMSHIVALARDGEHSIGNVVPLCATHNLQQGTRDFFDFFDQAERARDMV